MNTARDPVEEIMRLPADKRADAVDALIVRLHAFQDPEVQSAWAAEIARRESEDESRDVSWEELNAELIAKRNHP